MFRLNLGCNDRHFPGYINVDRMPPADEVADLSQRWPWPDSSIEHIIAHDIIEHLPDKIHTMNELWRVLAPGAEVEIAVPTTDGPGAWQDPTHISFWNRRSFYYYEDGQLCRERFGQHYGITARFRIVRENLEPTVDGPRLTIVLAAVKPAVAPPQVELIQEAIRQLRAEPLKVLGAMRIKNESEWIQQSIESQLTLCDKLLIFDDHSTDDTRDIVQSFGKRCVLLRSPFTGLDEARDKNFILRHIVAADPEWVFWIDGDEVLEERDVKHILGALYDETIVAGSLRLLYFWDSTDKVRVDGVYAQTARTVLFRVRGQPEGLHFPTTGFGGNFHCGNCPQGLAAGRTETLRARIKHYGYSRGRSVRPNTNGTTRWTPTTSARTATGTWWRSLARATRRGRRCWRIG
jgi:SAM-dependent methyltransferase